MHTRIRFGLDSQVVADEIKQANWVVCIGNAQVPGRTIESSGWVIAGVPNAESLFRVLRLAVHYGFVMGGDDEASGKVAFWNNAVSSVLREDHPNSVRCDCTLPCPEFARTLC